MQNARNMNRLETISLDELMDNVYPGREPIIPGLMVPGTFIFGGAPKLGKSWMMLELACYVSKGDEFCGYPVKQGTVLYLALEDDEGRLQDRVSTMFGDDREGDLHFAIKAPTVKEGLVGKLESFVEEHEDTRLIIIDTLQKVCDIGHGYKKDSDALAPFKAFTDTHNVALWLVHHTRKQSAKNPEDALLGSRGMPGAVDGSLVMLKDEDIEHGATLSIHGRDLAEETLYLVQDAQTQAWGIRDIDSEPIYKPEDPILEVVAHLVSEENPHWEGTPTELRDLTGAEMEPNKLTRHLNVNVNRLLEDFRVRYNKKRTGAGRKIVLDFCPEQASEEPEQEAA